MAITSYVETIGARTHKLAMGDLKPLSGLSHSQRDEFWQAWQQIAPLRRDEIAHAMVELAEDNIDLDFGEVLFWCLEDEDAGVRASAVEGLWENISTRLLRRLVTMLRSDPAPNVRATAAIGLSRFAYLAAIDQLEGEDARAVQTALLDMIRDQRQPLDVRRRSLESAGYFADADEVQRQIGLAYDTDEQLLRESALVAMGRSMLPRWLPIIARELTSTSPALRYEAARAAGEMAEDARVLLPKLAPLLNDDDSEVALAAIWALGQIGGEPARRALQQVRKSQDEARREAAAEALEELLLGDSLLGGA
jgi:HEAT repeat protein